MRISSNGRRVLFFGLLLVAPCAPALASDRSCADEMPEIAGLIDTIPDSGDKAMATHQYAKAQERLAAGKESSCLRYLESARSAVEAFQMHDDD